MMFDLALSEIEQEKPNKALLPDNFSEKPGQIYLICIFRK